MIAIALLILALGILGYIAVERSLDEWDAQWLVGPEDEE